MIVMVQQRPMVAGHEGCNGWFKHSKCFKADGYGKDSECRQSNIELLSEVRKT
jgi:hypothetical protein